MIEDPKNPTDLKADHTPFPLSRNNCVLIVISLILIIVGFVLMAGSPSTVTEYNPDIFSDRRIVVGPLLSFIGFVLMAVAIIVKPKRS
ncbi:MAG: DUF3098 domain-containing protein [Muribaculaceae bacterium]|nr:DUF3098 domain-containing protein [Muribaculaceae bacterium]